YVPDQQAVQLDRGVRLPSLWTSWPDTALRHYVRKPRVHRACRTVPRGYRPSASPPQFQPPPCRSREEEQILLVVPLRHTFHAEEQYLLRCPVRGEAASVGHIQPVCHPVSETSAFRSDSDRLWFRF